jgi:hypothetical protein
LKVAVIIENNRRFLPGITEYLQSQFETRVLLERTKEPLSYRYLAHRLLRRPKVKRLTAWSDVAFFEWSGTLLALGTPIRKPCGIVARLHRHEAFEYLDKVD